MTNAEKVIKIATENNGYITTKQVKDANINTIELTRLIKQNKIDRNILKDYVKTINTTRKNMTKIKDELQEINNKKEVSEEINIININ